MSVLKFSLLFLAAVSLSGCVVVPYEAPFGYGDGSRHDVPATVPGTIVKGKTTRTEVFLEQGEPDGVGKNADWFVYSSTFRHPGLGISFCIGGNLQTKCGDFRRQIRDYRRMVVRFDAMGIVSDVHIDSVSCIRWVRDLKTPDPCLDMRGVDLQEEDTLAVTLRSMGVLATHDDVRWPADEDTDCVYYGKLIVTKGTLYFVPGVGSPFDKKHESMDPALCPTSDRIVTYDDAEISDLSLVTGMTGHQAIKLSSKDGSHLTYQFYAESEDKDDETVDDASTVADATEVADDIKKLTGRVPDSFGGMGAAPGNGARTYSHVRWCAGWKRYLGFIEYPNPCEQPKDGYLVLTDTGFVFQLDDAGDGLSGSVAGEYADMQSVETRESGGLYPTSHWVVVVTSDGEIDAFDPGDGDSRKEITSILESHILKAPQKPD